MGEDTFL